MRTTSTVIRNRRPLGQLLRLMVWLVAVALVVTYRSPIPVAARSAGAQPTSALQTATVPMLAGTTQVINNGPGVQYAPQVDCNLVSYTSSDGPLGPAQIRYFDFATNTDHLVSSNAADSVSDVSGGRIAFTEATASGPQVVIFNTATQTSTVVPGSGHFRTAIGGNLVAFMDRSRATTDDPYKSDIGVYDLSTGTFTLLTDDALSDFEPAVSPAGNAVVWEKIQSDGVSLDVYAAVQTSPGVFTTSALTGAAGDDRGAITNGQIAVYTSTRGGETDIYFQPVAGGTETQLSIPGGQRNPSISGNLIAFESEVPVGGTITEYDIFVYDLRTGNLYQVTNTPDSEEMSDISVCNGVGRIVYSAPGSNGDRDLFAFTFQPPNSAADHVNDLIALVHSFNLPAGTENSLIAKLRDALAALAASDAATACDSLTAFIKVTQAQSGKKLTVEQANQLINSANGVKTDLGCQ